MLACARAPEDLESHQGAVLNGQDDRLEAFQAPAQVQGPLLGASAALVYAHHLIESAPDAVGLRAPTALAALGLCADEPFAGQPAAAFCSGVLIDDDLVATAGHCLGAGADTELAARRCGDLRVVFGYALAPPDRAVQPSADEVFACRRVVALDQDLAVLQLDRPPRGRLSPRPIAAAPARIEDELVVASHGAGLPLKIELAAAVTASSPTSGELTVAMDTFTGSSGGGLYNQDLELVGLVAGGAPDWEVVDGCTRAAHSPVPRERAAAAGRLVQAVCGAGWPSARLCGTPPSCGDGVCSAGEAPDCMADCRAAHCGDAVCEPPERGACLQDCARFADVPETWLNDPAEYGPPPDDGSLDPASMSGCSVAPEPAAPPPLAWLVTSSIGLAAISAGRARRRTQR
jgi:hypothetical protein